MTVKSQTVRGCLPADECARPSYPKRGMSTPSPAGGGHAATTHLQAALGTGCSLVTFDSAGILAHHLHQTGFTECKPLLSEAQTATDSARASQQKHGYPGAALRDRRQIHKCKLWNLESLHHLLYTPLMGKDLAKKLHVLFSSSDRNADADQSRSR